MKNSNGFFTVEAIASYTIFLTILLTLVPIIYQVKVDQETLSQRRYAQTALQDELLEHLYSSEAKDTVVYMDNQESTVTFHFKNTADLVQGCATWLNAKKKKEEFCLYGKKN